MIEVWINRYVIRTSRRSGAIEHLAVHTIETTIVGEHHDQMEI